MVIKNSLNQSHDIIKKIINEGDVVVDATAGNGNDTLLLAKLVGEKGRVYAFDIQQDAINNTIKKLQDNNLDPRVTVIKDGHQNMDKYVNDGIKAVMFNLGYLPGGDHSIATKGDTTITAVKKSMDLLMVGGIITVVIYYGRIFF
jgi:tRNA G37 N-methylase Trm5